MPLIVACVISKHTNWSNTKKRELETWKQMVLFSFMMGWVGMDWNIEYYHNFWYLRFASNFMDISNFFDLLCFGKIRIFAFFGYLKNLHIFLDISSTLFDKINLEKNMQVCFQNNIIYIIQNIKYKIYNIKYTI